ncbi:MAG: DUF882 domain-containing protein [Caulobacteraceae bacterium]|nr:DUF882 domain-containing protein [Caulobacteraceae bacterium]
MLERRSLLRLGLGAAAGAGLAAAPALALASAPVITLPSTAPAPAAASGMRSVSLQNLHTGEAMQGVYWADGDYIPEVLDAVNLHLRDYRTGAVHVIDPKLLDLLDALSSLTETKGSFQVISGYRSPETNALLCERSGEVAKHSLHMEGMAIDIRLADVDLDHLHKAALSLGRGGVGFYPTSDFVHVDVGPVRTWHGA